MYSGEDKGLEARQEVKSSSKRRAVFFLVKIIYGVTPLKGLTLQLTMYENNGVATEGVDCSPCEMYIIATQT